MPPWSPHPCAGLTSCKWRAGSLGASHHQGLSSPNSLVMGHFPCSPHRRLFIYGSLEMVLQSKPSTALVFPKVVLDLQAAEVGKLAKQPSLEAHPFPRGMVTASFPCTFCKAAFGEAGHGGGRKILLLSFLSTSAAPPASPSEGGSLSFSCLAPLPFQSCAFLSPGHQWNLACRLGVTTRATVVPERNPSGCKIGGQAGTVDQAGLSQVSLALHALYWLGRQAGDVAPVGHFHAPPRAGVPSASFPLLNQKVCVGGVHCQGGKRPPFRVKLGKCGVAEQRGEASGVKVFH